MTIDTLIQAPAAPVTIRRILFTDAQHVEFARRLCYALADGEAGANMFSCPLSATGNEPATHYVCEGHIAGSFDQALSNPNILFYACQQHEALEGEDDLADVTLAQCEDLLANSIVSDGSYSADIDGQLFTLSEDVHGFIARQGLQIIRPTLGV